MGNPTCHTPAIKNGRVNCPTNHQLWPMKIHFVQSWRRRDDEPLEKSLKRYMASGSHCPIGFHLVIGCRDGAAAPVGADDLWYHTGQSWVYVSTFLRLSVNWRSRGPFGCPNSHLRGLKGHLRGLEDHLRGPEAHMRGLEGARWGRKNVET